MPQWIPVEEMRSLRDPLVFCCICHHNDKPDGIINPGLDSLCAACGHQADHCIYCTPVTLVRYHQPSGAGEGTLETSTHLDAEKMPESEGELVAPKHETKNAAEEANVSGEIPSTNFYCDGIEMSHSK